MCIVLFKIILSFIFIYLFSFFFFYQFYFILIFLILLFSIIYLNIDISNNRYILRKYIYYYFSKQYLWVKRKSIKYTFIFNFLSFILNYFSMLICILGLSFYFGGSNNRIVLLYQKVFDYLKISFDLKLFYKDLKNKIVDLLLINKKELLYPRLQYDYYLYKIGKAINKKEKNYWATGRYKFFPRIYSGWVEKFQDFKEKNVFNLSIWYPADRPLKLRLELVNLNVINHYGLFIYFIACILMILLFYNINNIYKFLFWTTIEKLSYDYTKLYNKYLGRGNEIKGIYNLYKYLQLYSKREVFLLKFNVINERKKKNENKIKYKSDKKSLQYYGLNLKTKNMLLYNGILEEKSILKLSDEWLNEESFVYSPLLFYQGFNYGSSKIDEYFSSSYFQGDMVFFEYDRHVVDVDSNFVIDEPIVDNNENFLLSRFWPKKEILKYINYENFIFFRPHFLELPQIYFNSDEDLEDFDSREIEIKSLEYYNLYIDEYCKKLTEIWWLGRSKLGHGYNINFVGFDENNDFYYNLLNDTKMVLDTSFLDKKINNIDKNFLREFSFKSEEKLETTMDDENHYDNSNGQELEILYKIFNNEKNFDIDKNELKSFRGVTYSHGYILNEMKIILLTALSYGFYLFYFLDYNRYDNAGVHSGKSSYYYHHYGCVDLYFDYKYCHDSVDFYDALVGVDDLVPSYTIYYNVAPYDTKYGELILEHVFWIPELMEITYDQFVLNLNVIYLDVINKLNFFIIYIIFFIENISIKYKFFFIFNDIYYNFWKEYFFKNLFLILDYKYIVIYFILMLIIFNISKFKN